MSRRGGSAWLAVPNGAKPRRRARIARGAHQRRGVIFINL